MTKAWDMVHYPGGMYKSSRTLTLFPATLLAAWKAFVAMPGRSVYVRETVDRGDFDHD